MANPFLKGGHEEIETAILLENAKQCDLGKLDPSYRNSVAFTDGTRVFINDDENLARILPDYNEGMLKWLLWHEKYHMELKHHLRFFKYLSELKNSDCIDEFHLTKDEVNIIMDILVHDSLSKMFPELVETAVNNLAQMRNRNSLGYTFKTHNLEDMLNEYKEFKKPIDEDGEGDRSKSGEGEDEEETADDTTPKDEGKRTIKSGGGDDECDSKEKCHESGGKSDKTSKDDDEPEMTDESEPEPEHDKTDWSKLKDISSEEFIDKNESTYLMNKIESLKRKKLKLAKLTQTLNGLATTTKERTYSIPSYMNLDKHIIMKGRRQGKASLYLCFDASGSMGYELDTFKTIISKSIPHAMNVPCEWFTHEYGKGKFKDIMKVYADSGFNDDGDRTIELCWKAEKAGYSPIGITDGGGGISWSKDKIKELKRTVLVGPNKSWLEMIQKINPRIQILDV